MKATEHSGRFVLNDSARTRPSSWRRCAFERGGSEPEGGWLKDGKNAGDFGAGVARAKTRSRRESASGGEPLASAHNEPAGGSEKVVDKVDGDDKDGGGDGEGELDDGRR